MLGDGVRCRRPVDVVVGAAGGLFTKCAPAAISIRDVDGIHRSAERPHNGGEGLVQFCIRGHEVNEGDHPGQGIAGAPFVQQFDLSFRIVWSFWNLEELDAVEDQRILEIVAPEHTGFGWVGFEIEGQRVRTHVQFVTQAVPVRVRSSERIPHFVF